MGGGGGADAESLQPEGNGSGDKALVAKEVDGKVVVETADGKKAKKDEKDAEKKPVGGSVSIFKLFAFADTFDWLLIFIGTVGAAAHGCALPVFFLFFGKLLNGFGANVDDPDKTANVVGKVISTHSHNFHELFFRPSSGNQTSG